MDGKMTGTYVFDAYGTLFDVHSAVARHAQLVSPQSARVSEIWRNKQLEYSWTLTLMGRYRPFWDLTRAALHYALRLEGLQPAAADFDRLLNQYHHLSAFPENREVLQALRARGVRAGVLSNGDPAMLAVAVKSAGLAELLDPVLSVDAVRRYKTDPAAYALGPQALGLAAREILFVSSNAWDAVGATWYGYTTLWVNRAGAPPEQLGTEPTRTGRSLRDVLDFFPAAAPAPA